MGGRSRVLNCSRNCSQSLNFRSEHHYKIYMWIRSKIEYFIQAIFYFLSTRFQIKVDFIDLTESGCFIKRDGNLLIVRVLLTKQPLLFSIHIADYNVIPSPTTTSRTSREINCYENFPCNPINKFVLLSKSTGWLSIFFFQNMHNIVWHNIAF